MKSNESIISTHEVLNGGTIELWKINGFHCVKSVVSGVVKWSECVSKWKAEYFVFDAVHCGDLDF
jgi:hypothetical protein